MNIKTIEKGAKEFTANGRKYIIMDKISPERYKEYEKLVPALTFGLSFQEIYSQLHKLFGLLNKQEFANAAIVCHNVMSGIKNIDDTKRIHPALMMAALVIVREDEDARSYDETLMKDKIIDWQEEGMDMMGFFALSLSSIQGFRETLIKYTQESLKTIDSELQKEI